MSSGVDTSKRRFLTVATTAVGGIGAAFVAVPFVKAFNPSERAKAIGKPLFLGLGIFAVVGGLSAWGVVHLAWTMGVWYRRRRRHRQRQPA